MFFKPPIFDNVGMNASGLKITTDVYAILYITELEFKLINNDHLLHATMDLFPVYEDVVDIITSGMTLNSAYAHSVVNRAAKLTNCTPIATRGIIELLYYNLLTFLQESAGRTYITNCTCTIYRHGTLVMEFDR